MSLEDKFIFKTGYDDFYSILTNKRSEDLLRVNKINGERKITLVFMTSLGNSYSDTIHFKTTELLNSEFERLEAYLKLKENNNVSN